MRHFAGRTFARRAGAALACTLLGLVATAGPALGQSVAFGTGSAISKFGVSVVFTQPYSGANVSSASILIQTPDFPGPSIAPIDRVGSTSLTYTMDLSSGGLYPFEPVTAHFEAVLTDGTAVDGPDIHVTYADDRFAWKTKTGKVVRLHYIDASDGFAQQMLTLADGGVAKAATTFGVSESQPIDYYVYPSQSAFQQGLSQPETVGGLADPTFRTCYAIVAPGDTSYAAQVMPHEPTHIVFSDATGNPYHEPPRWLNEGFAQYISLGYDGGSRQLVSQAVKAGTLSSLLALTDFFPLDAGRIYLAYAEAVSAVDFMVRKYGQPAVAKLASAYAGDASDDEAFQAAFGVGVAGFNSAWLADNGVTPTKYGPKPAPTGPLPPGWGGSGNQSPGKTDNTGVYLLAGLMALAGIVLIGIAIVLAGAANRQAAR